MLGVLAIIAEACASTATHDVSQVPERLIAVPAGRFAGVAWPSEGTLVVEYDSAPGDFEDPAEVWKVDLDGTGFRPLPLPLDDDCARTGYHHPVALTDSAVGLVKACDFAEGEAPSTYGLVAFSLDQERVTPLITHKNLGYLSFSVPRLAASPALEAGIVDVGNETCGTIAFVDARGVRPLDLVVGTGSHAWNLSRYFSDPSGSCDSQGRAALPTWSIKDAVAFFGSPESVGVSGLQRISLPWNVYAWVPGEDAVRDLLRDVGSPTDLAWSPDGLWLAFTGEVEGSAGIWLLEAKGGEPIRVTTDPVFAIAWAPSGQSIAGTTPVDDTSLDRQIATYDVRSIVNAEN